VDSHTCRLRHRHRRFVIAGILPRWRARSVTEGQAGNLITAYALTIVVAGPIPTVARPF
jgi:predicted MFS family arabinose efflux permease